MHGNVNTFCQEYILRGVYMYRTCLGGAEIQSVSCRECVLRQCVLGGVYISCHATARRYSFQTHHSIEYK